MRYLIGFEIEISTGGERLETSKMHLHFEKSTNTKCDCSILSLSWMGKVPDDIPEVSDEFLFFFAFMNLQSIPIRVPL